MINTRFIRLFAGLSHAELKTFKKYLDSPFFGVRPVTLKLFQYLYKKHSKWHPIYEEWKVERDQERKVELESQLRKYLGKKEASVKIFPGESENDSRVRRMISHLKGHLIDYILQVAPKADRDEYLENMGLLRYHLQRGEYELLETKLSEVEKDRRSIRFRDHAFYFYSFQLEELLNDYHVRAGIKEYSYSMMMDFLDIFFVLYKLRMFCTMVGLGKRLKQPFRMSMMEELLEYIDKHNYLEEPLVKIYYLILQMELEGDGQKYYRDLQKQIRSFRKSILPNELRQIYAFMYNFLQQEHRKPGKNMTREMFQLFQQMYKDGTIYSDGLVTTTWFRVCLIIACQAGEYDWAEDFIYANEELIAGDNAKEVFDFGILTVLFYKGEYKEIIQRIDQLKLVNIHFHIRRRFLKIKCYFELGEPTEFFNQCENLRKSLVVHEDKVGPENMSIYSNFRLLADRLGRFKFDLKKVSQKFLDDLENLQVAEKEWLERKANELTGD